METSEWLREKLGKLMGVVQKDLDADPTVVALINGNLATALYLLNLPPDEADYDASEDRDEYDGPDEEVPRRDIRREMAGPLPSLRRRPARHDHDEEPEPVRPDRRPFPSTRKPVRPGPTARPRRRRVSEAPFNEVNAPEFGEYETIECQPNDLCECGGKVMNHPPDESLARRGAHGEFRAHVLCDQTRAYCYSPPNGRPQGGSGLTLHGM